MVLLILVACTVDTPREPEDAALVSAEELWEGRGGETVTLGPVVVTSPRTTRNTFFVQDPVGGPRSAVEIELFGLLPAWPPATGTEVVLTGVARSGTPPRLELDDTVDGEVFDTSEVPPWTEAGEDLEGALLTLELAVTSPPDPLHRADGDPLDLGGLFDANLPGFGAAGTATGILASDRLHLRGEDDWIEAVAPQSTPSERALDAAADADEGYWVRVEGTRVAPWSRDGRWTVLHHQGAGLWVDREAFDVSAPEDRLVAWTGEIRDGTLRTWSDAEDRGEARPILLGDGERGDVLDLTVTGLQQANDLGERAFDEGVLDDRFVELDGIVEGESVTAVVFEDGVYCVLP